MAIVLFLVVGAFALPQKPSTKPAPKEVEAPATTSAPPKLPEEKKEKPAPVLPDESKMVVTKTIEMPDAKPEPKKPEPKKEEPKKEETKKEEPKKEEPKKEEPKEEQPKKPETKPEPESEVKKTCVEQTRDCLEEANWGYTEIATCTWNAGVCLAGRLGIEF